MPAEKLLLSFSSAEAVFFHPLPAVLLPAPMHGLFPFFAVSCPSPSPSSSLRCITIFPPWCPSLPCREAVLCGGHRFLPLLFASCHLPARSPPFCGGSLLRAVCRFCTPLRIRLGDFLNSYERQNCFCLNLQLPLSCAFAPSPAAPPSPGHLHPVTASHPFFPLSLSPRLSLRSLCLFSLPVSCCLSLYALHCALRTTAVIRAQM